jgi:hypothetical protein
MANIIQSPRRHGVSEDDDADLSSSLTSINCLQLLLRQRMIEQRLRA